MAKHTHDKDKARLTSYVVGFILSLELTIAAYLLVVNGAIANRGWLIAAIIVLAVVQLLVQLVFFLSLDKESKPRWNLVTFLFAALVVLIVVLGSLWIMNNLDYHHGLSPEEIDTEIIEDEGIKL